jgi:inner membrane protein
VNTFLDGLRKSVLLKIFFVAFLVLVLLIPMSMVESVIHERQGQRHTAAADIMQSWGREQVVGGPLLVVPYRVPMRSDVGAITGWRWSRLYMLPRRLGITGALAPEYRYRGIHRVPVYTARMSLDAAFDPPDAKSLLPPDAVVSWNHAAMALAVSDARAIKSPVVLSGDLGDIDFVPGDVTLPGTAPMLVAAIPQLENHEKPFEVQLDLHLAGSARLAFLPVGDETRVTLSAPWNSPSFEGDWLPDSREITDEGFSASWRVLHLGRGFPSNWREGAVKDTRIQASAFGVRLYQSVSVYQQAVRAAKYAVLFIGLSFVVLLMMEVRCARLLHPLQYLLVGFANCMFYLLLVSLSEHMAFALAYLLAALASVGLIAGYSASVLSSRRLAAMVTAALGVTYGFLFVTLRAEDSALLMGTLGLFAALAALMYATRKIDWYRVSLGNGGPATDAASS